MISMDSISTVKKGTTKKSKTKRNIGKKLSPRERKKKRIRRRILGVGARPRLSVFKSSKHISAQIVSDDKLHTLVSASTMEKEVSNELKNSPASEDVSSSKSTKSVGAAFIVGKLLAKRGLEKGISAVVFDRNGYIFHGRVKAVAEGARKGGLLF